VHPMAKGFSFLFVTIRKIYTYIGHKTGRVLWDETEPRLSAPHLKSISLFQKKEEEQNEVS